MIIQRLQKELDSGKHLKRDGWKNNTASVCQCGVFEHPQDDLKYGASYVPDICVTIDGENKTWYATSEDARADDWVVVEE